MLITVSAAEKAGKSTLCQVLTDRYGATVRHWGPVKSDLEFLTGLQEDTEVLHSNPDQLIVYDRSFVCESVYSRLLNRGTRFGADPWLAEWLYGRAVQTLGLRVILAGPSAQRLAALRDETDLPVNPIVEKASYIQYGISFGYHVVHTAHLGLSEVETVANDLVWRATEQTRRPRFVSPLFPPHYAGPVQAAGVIVVDDSGPRLDGAWLPGTSQAVTDYARTLGPMAFSFGWMDVNHLATSKLRQAAVVYALGSNVSRRLAQVRYHNFVYLPLPTERTVLEPVLETQRTSE